LFEKHLQEECGPPILYICESVAGYCELTTEEYEKESRIGTPWHAVTSDEFVLNFVSGTPTVSTARGNTALKERYLAPLLRRLLLETNGLSAKQIREELFVRAYSQSAARVAVKRLRNKLTPLGSEKKGAFIVNERRSSQLEFRYYWCGPPKFRIYRAQYTT
jgi:hypothetical protein